MSLRIHGVDWEFRSIHGHQFLNRTEHTALIDPNTSTVTVSDSVPIDQQLEAAAKAYAKINSMPFTLHERLWRGAASGWEAEDFDRKQAARRPR